jgi:hypothetical protein
MTVLGRPDAHGVCMDASKRIAFAPGEGLVAVLVPE